MSADLMPDAMAPGLEAAALLMASNEKLRAQRDALLEALRALSGEWVNGGMVLEGCSLDVASQVRSAIAAAESSK